MLRTIRALALATLGIELLLALTLYAQTQAAASAFGQLFHRPGLGPSPQVMYQWLPLLYFTGCLLAFALGVVTLVDAGQQRRRRWFGVLPPLTVLVGYASTISGMVPGVIYTYADLFARPRIFGYYGPPAYTLYLPLLILALPSALALTALSYTGRATAQRARGLASAEAGEEAGEEDGQAEVDAPGDELADEFEVSPLDAPLDAPLDLAR